MPFNCNGITNKIDETLNIMSDKKVSIAAIQKKKFSQRSNLSYKLYKDGYTIIRSDSKHNGVSLTFIVDWSIKFKITNFPNQQTLSCQNQSGYRSISWHFE